MSGNVLSLQGCMESLSFAENWFSFKAVFLEAPYIHLKSYKNANIQAQLLDFLVSTGLHADRALFVCMFLVIVFVITMCI